MSALSAHKSTANAADAVDKVDLIDSYEQFSALRAQWQMLYRQDDTASYFLSWHWLSDLYRRRDHAVCILGWRPQAHLPYAAFLPLRRRIRQQSGLPRLYNALSMAGSDWADHTGILCDPTHEEHAVPALAKALQDLPWGKLRFDGMRIQQRRLSLLLDAFEPDTYRIRDRAITDNNGSTDLNMSPVIVLASTWEEFLAQLSANTRQRIRRYRRRLSADASLRIALSSLVTRQRDLAVFRTFWHTRWATIKGRQADTMAEKYVRILQDGMHAGSLHMPMLLANGKPVAMNACYVDRVKRSILFFVGARDLAFRTVPAGLLLHAWMIEWAIGEGFERYELLRGDEAYKYSLGAVHGRLHSLSISRRELPVVAQLLDSSCRQEAVDLVESAFCEGSSIETVEALYAQLLESWPGDQLILDRYAIFLEQRGQTLAASTIRKALEDAVPLRKET